MIIAVDFDGTIVEHRYPAIGKELFFAFDTLKALQKDGHQLILWTYRHGALLDEAVEYCRKNGVEFLAVNASYIGEEMDDSISRKVNADMFIDDRNFGGFPGWGFIYQTISGNAPSKEADYWRKYERASERTLCGFLKRIFCKDLQY
jgi:hydroxymethylpyrimidine pyrophosphatase-like HAD family hydrolase